VVEPCPSVRLFALGGTIAAVPEADGVHTRIDLSVDDLVRSVPGLASVATLDAVSFRQQLSADLGVTDIAELAREIDLAASSGADGVVVAQGTDTLEETAFLLDHLVTSDVPVVVTGAMRHAGAAGADGPANLLAAIQVAVSPLAAHLGALVVFHDEIHAARFVRKVHSTSTGAFTSPGVGPIGWITGGRVRIPLIPRTRSPRIPVPPDLAEVPRVAIVRLGLGEDATVLDLLAGADLDGLVVEVYGAGHVSARTAGTIKKLSTVLPLVVSSRTGTGELHAAATDIDIATNPEPPEDGGPAAGRSPGHLISGAALDGLKARLLLTLLLAAGADHGTIVAAFARTVD
jgi:L-asparaginase